MKKVKRIHLKIVIFTAVKNRCILHGRVFLMKSYDNCDDFGFDRVNLPLKKENAHKDYLSFQKKGLGETIILQ